MQELWSFLKICVIIIGIVLIVFIVLLSLPNSRLRKSMLKIYGIFASLLTLFFVIYIISPIDAIPDIIPAAGQIDDLAALMAAAASAITAWISLKESVGKIKSSGSSD